MAWDRERLEVLLGEGLNPIIPGRPPTAKASNQNGSDGEGLKLGEQTGLDTRVVPALNDAD